MVPYDGDKQTRHTHRYTTRRLINFYYSIVTLDAFDSFVTYFQEVYDHNGIAHNVTLEPGDMLLFESHSAIHGMCLSSNNTDVYNLFWFCALRGLMVSCLSSFQLYVGHPFPLKGRFHAMIFIHFEPTGKAYSANENGYYFIDPDGRNNGELPMKVKCDFDSDSTEIGTQLEQKILPCSSSNGCSEIKMNYQAPLEQIKALIDS